MRALLYSHFFLACCAVAMIAETALIFRLHSQFMILYVSFVFSSTIVAYNIKGLLSVLRKSSAVNLSEKIQWARSNKTVFLIVYGFAACLSVFFWSKLPFESYQILFPMALLTVIYSLPFKIGRYYFSPRYIPFLKTLLVAFVWTIVIVYLPCRMSGIPLAVTLFWLLGEFMFLFSLAILFDIKDIESDRIIGIKTFPQKLGVRVTKTISIVLMGSRILWIWVHQPGSNLLIIESIVCFIYLSYIVTFINTKLEEKYYMGWVDGLMLGKYLLVLTIYLI